MFRFTSVSQMKTRFILFLIFKSFGTQFLCAQVFSSGFEVCFVLYLASAHLKECSHEDHTRRFSLLYQYFRHKPYIPLIMFYINITRTKSTKPKYYSYFHLALAKNSFKVYLIFCLPLPQNFFIIFFYILITPSSVLQIY